MAKIKHNNFMDTVDAVLTDAERHGLVHLYAQGDSFNGRNIQIGGRELFHFGATGYLGLEQDARLKKAAIGAIGRYGTQFPLSRTYLSHPLYRELEEKLSRMYGSPVLITKNSTLGHMGVVPTAIADEDAVLLDHQVHWSVQSAAKMLKLRNVPVDMVRHNDMDMLEDKLRRYAQHRRRVWYMADGVYSMYGDLAPVDDLMVLGARYPQLRLYFDDVHGMSWAGKNGTGHVMDKLGELPENVLLFGTLSKTFGASGAFLACSDKALYRKIRTFGGPLTFSAQLEPASVAAATASADIHLSPEIYVLQRDLRERIDYANALFRDTDLPLISGNESPVFYIGTGMPRTGYNFVDRLMNEGFYVNLGLFPAVPVKNTGVRATISRHNQKQEIKALVEAMAHHFPKALEDTHTQSERVYRAFRLDPKTRSKDRPGTGLNVQWAETIHSVDKELWDTVMGGRGVYDWEGLRFLEGAFQGNAAREHNWVFRYLVITDREGRPVLATFMTCSLWKDDLLATESVSRALERERESDPYYLTSTVWSMGSLCTEGDHLYWDKGHPMAREALYAMMALLETRETELGAKMTVLRDFPKDTDLHSFLLGQGFVRVQMPHSCTVSLKGVRDMDDYIARLSPRNRRHYRKEIVPYTKGVVLHKLQGCGPRKLVQIKRLYAHVHRNNLDLNTFSFPDKLFDRMAVHPDWEFLALSPKEDPDTLIGAMLCYTNMGRTYVPAFVGLDYELLGRFNTYRQLLYRTIERAMELGIPNIDLGITAAFEKRKLGAEVREKYAYIQSPDNYTLELMGILEGPRDRN